MTIELITTIAIQCDYPQCFEEYSDLGMAGEQTTEESAIRDGWVAFDGFSDAKHYCPSHANHAPKVEDQ